MRRSASPGARPSGKGPGRVIPSPRPQIPAHRTALLLLVLCVWAPACGGGEVSSRPASSINLQPIPFGKWQRELGERRGRIVVVDFWATWCIPCMERFPHLVDLYRRYGDKGVQFISMCLDDRDDPLALEQARQFLRRQDATFSNYLMDENITRAFEKLDLLGIPAVFIYDPAGSRRFKLTGDDPNHQFTDQDVDQAILSLLAESPGG